MGGGGWKERESFGIRIHAKRMKKKKKKKLLILDLTLEKEEGFQFQTSQGTNGKSGVPGEKTTLVGCSANPMILILMTVSLSSKLWKTTTKTITTTEREGERENSELYNTRIKILGSCLFLQSVLLIYMPIGYT